MFSSWSLRWYLVVIAASQKLYLKTFYFEDCDKLFQIWSGPQMEGVVPASRSHTEHPPSQYLFQNQNLKTCFQIFSDN